MQCFYFFLFLLFPYFRLLMLQWSISPRGIVTVLCSVVGQSLVHLSSVKSSHSILIISAVILKTVIDFIPGIKYFFVYWWMKNDKWPKSSPFFLHTIHIQARTAIPAATVLLTVHEIIKTIIQIWGAAWLGWWKMTYEMFHQSITATK